MLNFIQMLEMGDEIKTWKVRSVKHKVAMVLIIDGVSFSYNVDDGIVFSGTVSYVQKLKVRLVKCYGVSLEPIINEYRKDDGNSI